MKKKLNTKRVGIYLPCVLIEVYENQANKLGLSRSELMRRILEPYAKACERKEANDNKIR